MPNFNLQIPGSEEWKIWRRTKITATDAAVCLNENPWTSKKALYHQKLSGQEIPDNLNMARGREYEEEARLWFQTVYGGCYKPVCVEHDSIPWMAASIDGYDHYEQKAIEIKIPMAKNYTYHAAPPWHHVLQMQHQLHCLNLGRMDYVVYSPEDKDGFVIPVQKDNDLVDRMLLAEEEFYKFLISYREPI